MEFLKKFEGGMRLTTSLQKSAIFPIILAIMVTLGLVLRSRYTGQAQVRQDAAESAIASIIEFNSATAALAAGDDETNLKIWESRYKSLQELMSNFEAKGFLEQYSIMDIRNSQEDIRSVLQKLVTLGYVSESPRKAKAADEVYKALTSQLTHASNAMMASAMSQARNARDYVKMIERLSNNILLVFVAIFSMLMAGAAIAYSQNAVKRLRELKEVAGKAASGDYSGKITNVGVNDEIGQTLRAFNSMLGKFDELFNKVSGELNNVKQSSDDSRKTADVARESNMRLADALTRLKRAQGQTVQQERLHALQQIGSGMTRNFNDALTPILSTSDFLLTYPDHLKDENELIDNLKMINSAARLAHTQVRRLANIFKIADKGEVQCVELKHVITNAIKLVDPRRKETEKQKNIKIDCVTNIADVPAVQAVEADITDALIELLVNSFESFSESGTVNITVRAADNNVVLELKDDGAGMSEDVRSRALEPFFSTKGRHYSGMGLATVQSAAQQYGGSVFIQSEEDDGTAITLTLPVCSEESKEQAQAEQPKVPQRKILVIDDEEWILKIVRKGLASEGHHVDTALSGNQGLALLKAGGYDLVILDWALPDMNGGELAGRIQKEDSGVAMVLLTGFGDLIQREGSVPPGIKMVLSKPVTMQDLRNAVAKATG